jgi:hypothetical protein
MASSKKNINYINKNNVNLEEEITFKLRLGKNSDKNNVIFTRKAKLKEKFIDVVNKFKVSQCPVELRNFTHLALNSDNSLIDFDKNLYQNNIKNDDIICIPHIRENNNNGIENINYYDNNNLKKEEKDALSQWYDEYKANKLLMYFNLVMSLEKGQKPPDFNSTLNKEEFLDFVFDKESNLGLIVKEHEHKLIHCLINDNWKCSKCNNKYDKSESRYYCSLCDYNMCDQCRKLGNYEKKLLFPKNIIPPIILNYKFKNNPSHIHRLVYCRPIRSFLGSSTWGCNKCLKTYIREIWSFYCTLCNFDLCYDCAK